MGDEADRIVDRMSDPGLPARLAEQHEHQTDMHHRALNAARWQVIERGVPTMTMFSPAVRAAAYGRIALTGPSGAGKTYTGLGLAHLLADGRKPAVIDTERGKSQLYKGVNGWDFDVACPQTYSPASLTEALGVASGAGYPVVLIDSWSHYWSGAEGMQEQVDRRAKGGNNFSGWKEMRPDERRMIDAIVSYPGHVIVTLRVKTAYVVEQVEKNGKSQSVPKKIGLKPDQREGLEYEFDLVCDLDLDNTLTVSKTRLPMLRGAVIPEPGDELATTIRDWLADGEETRGPLYYRTEALSDDATVAYLRQMHADVRAAGLANAPVTDGDGNPTVLADLIVARGRALGAGPAQAVGYSTLGARVTNSSRPTRATWYRPVSAIDYGPGLHADPGHE